jgi:hypothetical protein
MRTFRSAEERTRTMKPRTLQRSMLAPMMSVNDFRSGIPQKPCYSGQASRVKQKSLHKAAENIHHQNDHVIGHRTRLAPFTILFSIQSLSHTQGQQTLLLANRLCCLMNKSAAAENRRRSFAWSFARGLFFVV